MSTCARAAAGSASGQSRSANCMSGARDSLESVEVFPFHYHAGMPALESVDPQRFRHESLAMEHDTGGWKGLFLCSAFLVKAVIPTPAQ